MQKLNLFQIIGISFITAGLFAGLIPHVFSQESIPSYSTYTMNKSAQVSELKAGKFSLFLDYSRQQADNKLRNTKKTTNSEIWMKEKIAKAHHQSYSQNMTTPTITPTPTAAPAGNQPTATPTPTSSNESREEIAQSVDATGNLIPNHSFEDGGVTWLYSSTVTIDTGSNGNDGVSSIHITRNSNYIFSALVDVEPNVTYSWQTFIRCEKHPELQFYIDEFDENGDWISGQWKGELAIAYKGIKSWSYTPSSDQVKFASVQYSTPGSKGAEGDPDVYIDSVVLKKN